MPVSTDLTARIRERCEDPIEAALDPQSFRQAVIAVMELCDDEDHRLREQGYTTFVGAVSAADLRRAVAHALDVPTESEPVDDGRHYAVIAPGYTVCRQTWNVARYTQSKIGGRIVLLDADGGTHPVCGVCGVPTESEPCREHQGGA